MRIMLTNDDGIASVGLHRLAHAMTEFGDVVIVAPDTEYSGAGAAIGALWDLKPVVRREHVEGIDNAWSVNGPPALCVLYARMGLFGEPFDLVVSGINPGVNVGRSIYHSGTIGAALTARNGGVSGIAVSQMFPESYEGQAIADIVDNHLWDTAASVAREFVGGLLEGGLPPEPIVANINVPNVDIDDVKGWKMTEVGVMPPATLTTARLVPTDDPDRFDVDVEWGKTNAQNPPGSDGSEVADGYVSITFLGRIAADDRPDVGHATSRLDALIGRGDPAAV